MQKYKVLHWIAFTGNIAILCFIPRDDSSKSRLLGALAVLPCTLIALWAAWEYKKTDEKQKVDFFSVPFSDAHPYIATGIVVFINALLLVSGIILAIQGS